MEDRAFRGRLGWRSRMKATDKLINALGDVNQLTPTPGELIRLHGADRKPTNYKDTPFTE